jgi:hypothetical protein
MVRVPLQVEREMGKTSVDGDRFGGVRAPSPFDKLRVRVGWVFTIAHSPHAELVEA